ncbi:MAG: penicillin-binding protein 2 [Pseudomonadota bacterium]
MATKLSSRDEIRIYEERYKYIYYAILFFFSIILLRLWYLQIYKGTELYLYAEKNRIWQEKDRAPRGMIFDRNGKLLVDNKPSFDIVIRTQFLSEKEKTIEKLSKMLGISTAAIEEKLLKAQNLPIYYPIPIAEDVDRDKVALVESNKLFMPGVDVFVRNKRTYLYGEAMAHVIGYIGEVSKPELNRFNPTYDLNSKKLYMGDYVGKFGLEKMWDMELRGIDGARYVVVDANGRMKSSEEVRSIFGDLPSTQSEPGLNLVLTIDSDLQELAYKYFKEGNRKGAVIAIDPRSGEVLTMFSAPGFDPTVMSKNISVEEMNEIRNNPFRPFYNKTIQDHYAPGSTFKPLVLLSALEEGLVDEDFTTSCVGRLWFGNRYFHCHKREGHGKIGLYEGLVRSCDSVFYRLGIKLGVDKVYKYAVQLGLSQKAGIDLPDEISGLMPSSDWKYSRLRVKWMPGEDLSMAIGQGYDLVTPIQLADAYAGIATGVIYRPHVLKKVEMADGKELGSTTSEKIHTIDIKPEVRDFLLRSLWGVVNEPSGTAWWYRLNGLDMAGKTGTVQLSGISQEDVYRKCENLPEIKRYHGWFVGFAPYKNPEIVVAVIAEHSCHGSSGAAPLVRDIVKAYYDKYGFAGRKDIDIDKKPTPQVVPRGEVYE